LQDSADLALTAYTDIRITTQAKAAYVATRLATFLSQLNSAATRRLRASQQSSRELMESVQSKARESVETARINLQTELNDLAAQARANTSEINRALPELFAHITLGAMHMLRETHGATERAVEDIEALARRATRTRREDVERCLQSIAHDAPRIASEASVASENLMREIISQGPEKTLRRGFVIARDHKGRPLTTAAAARSHDIIELQFSDAAISARIDKEK
jgi:exodeoxyribonuclease VII large subunit